MIKITKAPEKKITGSRFAAVVGRSEYKTEFEAWCEIMGLHKFNVDNVFIDFGNKFESKLLAYGAKTLGKFEKPNKIKVNYDCFPENKRFGGIPDGITPQNVCIEAKLTNIKNKDIWEKEDAAVAQYLYQLYDYQTLLNMQRGTDSDKVIFLVGFYTDDELIDMKWSPKKANTLIKEIDYDKALAEAAFREANEWWDRHVVTGESPEPKTKEDLKLALKVSELVENRTIEFTEEMVRDIDRYLELKAELKPINKEFDALKESLKLLMVGKDAAIGRSDYIFGLPVHEREAWDKAKFKKENPKLYAKYEKTPTKVAKLNIKKV